MTQSEYDVIIVGGGNAGLTSALAAAQVGRRVLVAEWAPESRRGGNSFYAGGDIRFPHDGVRDLLGLMPELGISPESVAISPYSEQEYFDEMATSTRYLADGDLVETLVSKSAGSVRWLREQGVRFDLSYGRHSMPQDGVSRFYGGTVVEYYGGGPGCIDQLSALAAKAGVDFWYRSRLSGLLTDPRDGITGVRLLQDDGEKEVRASSVVLACGGFEANPAMRAQYLGSGWDLARHRGTEFNLGDGHIIGMQVGAEATGHWSGCHAVAWDLNAPKRRDRAVPHGFERESYTVGIIVNQDGRRFVDEGADFFTYTYAKYGRAILAQPDQVAYQIFDSKVAELLLSEYNLRQTTVIRRDSLAELAAALEIPQTAFLNTVATFNEGVQEGSFDITTKDGKAATGISPVKSNWAQRLDTPPFVAYPVTCGITFTYGGLRVDTDARVLKPTDEPIKGLYAAGEIIGGLYYHNYLGGTGLMAGAVFGRLAGANAALRR
jgi:tricarballylate dehydrogenase